MTSQIAVVAVNATDPAALARFWCEVLGWQVLESSEEGVSIGPADGSGPGMDLLPVDEPKVGHNRLHLDLRADSSGARAELDRLLALGARRVDVGQPADATWVVLADPEGNEFCLLARTAQEVAATVSP